MEKAEKVQILRDLVSINTVGGNELEAAQYLKSVFDKYGIKNEVRPLQDNRANLVAEIGSGKPILVVSGHLDVVAVNEQEWQSNPFTLIEKDGQFYGRGTADMKSGMAAFVIAMIEAQQAQQPQHGTVRLLATADEEVGEIGAAALYEDGAMKDADALLLGEPTGYLLVHTHTGAVDLQIQAHGQAAHSSRPQTGINAVENLIEVLNLIKNSVLKKTQYTISPVLHKPTLFNIDCFHGGEQVNTIPSVAEAEVNIRTISEYPNDQIIDIVNKSIATYNELNKGQITSKVTTNLIPISGNPDSRLIKLIQKIAQPYYQALNDTPAKIQQHQHAAELMGVPYAADKILAIGAMGGTDASKLLYDCPRGADYVIFGPGNETPHQSNEHISQQMFFDFIDIYRQLFTDYFVSEPKV